MKNPKNKKSNKGITLVALVITIIVMLILSVVTLNGIFGENGLIKRVKEAKMLAILADIMENLENNIVQINTENLINNKRTVAAEMMDALEKRSIVKKEVLTLNDYLVQASIENDDLDGVTLGFNGDVWVDNYKRGKVNLSSNVNTVTTKNQTKITVIDGTIEEVLADNTYYVHALKDRDDFVYWINQYGEITSYLPDTIVTVTGYSEIEWTAIYGYEIEDEEELFYRINMAFDTNLEKGEYGEIYCNYLATFLRVSCSVREYITERENGVTHSRLKTSYEYGGMPICYGIAFTDNYEDLIDEKSGINEVAFIGNADYKYKNELSLMNDFFSDDIEKLNFIDFKEKIYSNVDDGKNWSFGEVSGNHPYVHKEDLNYLTKRLVDYNLIDNFKEVCEEQGFKGKRIYYRGVIVYVLREAKQISNKNWEEVDSYYTTGDKATNWYWEPTIKYIDL